MSRVLYINANRQSITMTHAAGLSALQALVGGSIQIGCRLPDDHVLFVDEEGLFKPQRWFFRLRGLDTPFAGNGVIVGPEKYNRAGDYLGNRDVSLHWLPAVVEFTEFLNRAYIDSWAKATASEPEMAIQNMDTGEVEVIAYRGSVWGNMPRPEDESGNQ